MSYPSNQPQPQQPQPQPLQSQPQQPVQQQTYPQQQSYPPQQPYAQQQYAQQQPYAQQIPAPTPMRAPMGWYAVQGTPAIRWWDGDNWAAYQLYEREPRAYWFAMEPPTVGFVLGPLFIMLGLSQFAFASIGTGYSRTFLGVMFILIGCFWMLMAGMMTQLRSRPSPTTPQILTPIIEPLPGRIEGPNAGWVAVSSRVSRWWSGSRWGEYIFENKRVRPTYGGQRAYRRAQVIAFVCLGVGLLCMIGGVILGVTLPLYAANLMLMYGLVTGIALTVVGGVVLPTLYMRKASFVLPAYAPSFAAAPSQYGGQPFSGM